MCVFVDDMNARLFLLALTAVLTTPFASVLAEGLCRAAITQSERAAGVPDRLLQAVAIIESGRRDATGAVVAWPWTINVEGVGEVFETKAQAIAAVTAHRARGARSIDVGCMQVNLMHHAAAFATLDDAFDPAANARYAASFLQRLLAQTGSWPRAVAGYHSLTPDIGAEYARKVLAVWAQPEPRGAPAAAMAQSAPGAAPPPGAVGPGTVGPGASGSGASGSGASGTGPALPAPARALSPPGASAPQMTGRTLESYRALPTRLALPFRRS